MVKTHTRIDTLYDALFSGPTPGFPLEDSTEASFYVAREKNDDVQSHIRSTRRVHRVLGRVTMLIKRAKAFLQVALECTKNSLVFFDEALLQLQSYNETVIYALSSIESAVSNLQTIISPEMERTKRDLTALLKAARISEHVKRSRSSITEAIENCQGDIVMAEEKLHELVDTVKGHEQKSLSDIKETARSVEDSRQSLQHVRQAIFEKVAGFGEAAPAYSECCDRAEGYCNVPSEGGSEHEVELGEGSYDGTNVMGGIKLPGYELVSEEGRIGSTT
jgi:hypothetical protein